MSRTTSPRMAKLLAAGSIVVAGLMAAAGAQAHGGVSLSVGIGVPGVAVGVGAPVYATPYVAPAPVYMPPRVRFTLGAANAAHLLARAFFKPQVVVVALLATALAAAVEPVVRQRLGQATAGAGVLTLALGLHPLMPLRVQRAAAHTMAPFVAVPQQLTNQTHVASPRLRMGYPVWYRALQKRLALSQECATA